MKLLRNSLGFVYKNNNVRYDFTKCWYSDDVQKISRELFNHAESFKGHPKSAVKKAKRGIPRYDLYFAPEITKSHDHTGVAMSETKAYRKYVNWAMKKTGRSKKKGEKSKKGKRR